MPSRQHLFSSVLCPVDFSPHSGGALRYAALLASRYGGRLIVMFVEDPMLAAAASVTYTKSDLTERNLAELRRFAKPPIEQYGLSPDATELHVLEGEPHEEIAGAADRFHCDLVVMGAHGLTGTNRLMVGSTTHRVLRESSLPILATPPTKGRIAGPGKNWPGERIVAPVDLGPRDEADAQAAAAVAQELGSRLQLVHIVEPVVALPWLRKDVERGTRERQRVAMARLEQIQQGLTWASVDSRVEAGKPAEEISKIASHKSVGLVIMTRRQGQGLFGPRQGSISYQLLTQASVPVLALPGESEWMGRLISR